MGTQRIEDLLRAVARHGIERARPGLAREIKNRIPDRLTPHRVDMILVIAGLRISRSAAAAAILVALLVIGSVFGGHDAIGKQMYQDSKLLLQYTLGGENACRSRVISSLMQFRDDLAAQGREVVYYGDQIDFNNRYAVVMHWKLDEGKYGVVLGDLSIRTIGSDTLIRLQTHMLYDHVKK